METFEQKAKQQSGKIDKKEREKHEYIFSVRQTILRTVYRPRHPNETIRAQRYPPTSFLVSNARPSTLLTAIS